MNNTLTKENFQRYISSIIKQDISSPSLLKKADNIYYLVKEEDSLFWSFYILKYGLDQYLMNKGKSFDIVQQIKIKAIESMKSHTDLMKQYKLKKTEIEQNLLYDTHISKSSFFYLCICYDINVVIIEDRVYYECIGNDTVGSNIYMLKKQNHHYEIYKKLEQDYQDKYYKISNVSKPILGIGSYKVNDLQIMCKKLKIDLPGDAKKKEMYEEIIKAI